METPYEVLAEKLRAEVEAYGRLFQMLEDQRKALLAQDPEWILSATDDLNGHARTIDQLRHDREGFFQTLREDESQTLSAFIATSGHESRPLLEALYEEVNRLIGSSRRQLERNHMFFRRAWDLSQGLMQALNPQAPGPPVYQRNGLSRRRSGGNASTYANLA